MLRIDLNDAGIARAAASAAAVLRSGGVGVVPTETVYGLTAPVGDAGAERIYALKHRAGSKRLGWFIGDWRMLEAHGVLLTPLVCGLAERYLPGALTIIAPTATGDSIGFRVPDHPFLRALLAEWGEPLLQTSANLSGAPDSLTAETALAGLDGEVDFVVDGGALPSSSLASTVVDARFPEPRILRQGALKIDLRAARDSADL